MHEQFCKDNTIILIDNSIYNLLILYTNKLIILKQKYNIMCRKKLECLGYYENCMCQLLLKEYYWINLYFRTLIGTYRKKLSILYNI